MTKTIQSLAKKQGGHAARYRLHKKLPTVVVAMATIVALTLAPLVAQAAPDHAVSAQQTAAANVDFNGTACNIADAIRAANTDQANGDCPAGDGPDTITLLEDITLSGGLPRIKSDLTINGDGFFLDGANSFTVLRLLGELGSSDYIEVTLNEISIQNGRGIDLSSSAELTVNNGAIINHTVPGIWGSDGTRIVLNNTTVSGNQAEYGGGIRMTDSKLTLNNSTVTGNTATGYDAGNGNFKEVYGGGIYIEDSSDLYLYQSIVAGNNADSGKDIYAVNNYYGPATSEYSVVGTSSATRGKNFRKFIPDATDVDGSSDQQNIALASILDPTLANNGGSIKSHALVSGSPAIDLSPTGLATDQRGVSRPQRTAFDSGAYELEVNQIPAAENDAYSTEEDSVLTVDSPGVLDNDSDADGGTLTATEVSAPSNGTLTFNADGSFTYVPDANFSGSDSFTYKANDGEDDSNTATVTITVNAVNDAPVASDDAYSTDENTTLTVAAPGVLDNDSDTEDDTLTATAVSTPSNGTVALNSDGSFTYTPNADFTGDDSFTYVANDGSDDSNVATVTITVNELPDQSLNLLQNPGFELGTEEWAFWTDGGGTFATESPGYEGTQAARIDVATTGESMQLYQKGFELEPKTRYKLAFAAKSSTGNDVALYVHQHKDPYTNYGLRNFLVDLTDSWNEFEIIFRTKNFTKKTKDTRMRLWLKPYIESGDTYWFDSFSLSKVQPGVTTASLVEMQTGELAGQVTMPDSLTTAIVKLVDMETEGENYIGYAQIDETGTYRFSNVPYGYYQVQVEVPAGYLASEAIQLAVDERGHDSIDFTLDSVSNNLYLPLVQR